MTKTVDIIEVEQDGQTIRKPEFDGSYRVVEYHDDTVEIEPL